MAKYLNPKADLTADALVAKAFSSVEESGYTDAELLAIDKYWDQISRERTAVNAAERKGRAEGEISKAFAIARKMLTKGFCVEDIADMTGLSSEDINAL